MRRIKSLGLGALMALALLAVPAGASATGGIEADSYPVTLKGESAKGSHKLSFSWFASQKTCPFYLEDDIEQPSPAIVADWILGGDCKEFNANGCKLQFHPGTQNTFGFGPAGCGPVKFKINGCQVGVSPQTLPATFTNTGEGSNAKLVVGTKTSFTWTSESSVVGCPTKGNIYKDTIEGTWEIKGFDKAGNQVGIEATDLPYSGFFIAGGSETEARFEAERYPLPILGALQPKGALTFYSDGQEDGVQCSVAELDGDMASASTEVFLTAQYGGCKSLNDGFSATMSMSGCSYALGLDSVGPPYVGDFALACSGGASLKVVVDPPVVGTCTFTIPVQGLGPVAYLNVGSSATRRIAADLEGKGIDHTVSEVGFGCFGATGLYSEGTLSGGITLEAPNQ